jgi:thiamine-monophosphate kinase
MNALTNARLIRCAIDNSDGLLPSLVQLAVANSSSITLDLDTLAVSEANHLKIDPARLWLGWGDWNVLGAVAPGDFETATRIAGEIGAVITRIGEFSGGRFDVVLRRGNKELPAPRLESERFAVDSWFSEGIQGYVDRLVAVALP